MKIAIASSGLGHVARGIETWALDLAQALARHAATSAGAADIEVTLFAAAPLPDCSSPVTTGSTGFDGIDGKQWESTKLMTTIHAKPCSLSLEIVPCFKRGGRAAGWLARWMPGFTWRWGLKSTYGWEQFTFWRNLAPRLRRGGYDILHVQDPMLAYWCRIWRRRGRLATREILAHGTEEPPEFLAQFEFVQHLAPWHLESTGIDRNRQASTGSMGRAETTRESVANRETVSKPLRSCRFLSTPVDPVEKKQIRNQNKGVPS